MHEVVTGFLAALHHDGKKLLLNTKQDEERHYASWGTSLYASRDTRSHEFWDTLDDQGDPSDLAPWHQQAVPLPPDVVTLIKLQGGWTTPTHEAVGSEGPRPTPAEVNALSPRLAISLRAADAIHKALYQGDDSQVGEIHVARQFPFSYPFYGRPIVWRPEPAYFPPHMTPDALRQTHTFDNPRRQFKKFLDHLAAGGLNMAQLLDRQSTELRAFPDSTYLPLTSLGFHQRLVAALFLLLYRELDGYCFDPKPEPLRPVFYLNTVVSPPERLTNRLRDTAVVRKISHRLQHAFHAYLSDTYLTELGALALRHPDENPLFFYNKDATVLLNRADDQARIEAICRDVAQKTGAVLTLMPMQIDVTVALSLNKLASYSLPVALQAVQVTDVEGCKAEACPREPVRRTIGHTIGAIVPIQIGDPIPACAVCNKPAPLEQLTLRRGDALCALCLELRERYPYCTQCNLYVLPPGQACPYCGATSAHKLKRGYPSPKVLQGERDTGEGHRVAYVALHVHAAYNTIQTEAEVLMAHFRRDRAAFERGTADQQAALRWNLARTRPSQSGLFEYLQAAQDMARFQHDLEEALKASWEDAAWHRPRSVPRGQYRMNLGEDLEPPNLGASFLYRSPTLTLVVLPEQVLPAFYRQLMQLTTDLQLAHTVRMVTCRHNQPVWMALRALGIHEAFRVPQAEALTQILKRLRHAQKALDEQLANDKSAIQKVREKLQGQVVDGIIKGMGGMRSPTLPKSLHDLGRDVSGTADFIRLALFLTVSEAIGRLLQGRGLRLSQRQPARLQALCNELRPLAERAHACAQTIWQEGQALLLEAEAVHAQLRADQVLTVLRSGVHRTFRGAAVVTFLLDQVVQSPAYAGSQLGELATYAQTVLTQVQALPEADRARAFWANLQLELDARGISRGRDTNRGDAGLPLEVITLLQEAFRLPGLTPEQVPGLLLEMAVRQKDQRAAPRSERRQRSHVSTARS